MTKFKPAPSQELNRAVSAYQTGMLVEAEQICQKIINGNHDHFDALHLLAVVQSSLGKKHAALASYDGALTVRPGNAEVLYNRGNTLKELKRFEQALASYDGALTVRPDFAEALSNRGLVLHELKRFTEALASHDRALIVRPDNAEMLSNRALTLYELRRFEEALASYDRALSVRPNYAEVLSNRGLTLHALKRFAEALASYDRSLSVRPDFAEAHCNRGLTLHALKRFAEALASYDRALTVRPDYAEALCNRGLTLHELKRFEEALASYDRALAGRPDYAEVLYNRGNTLNELKRFDEALASFDRALILRPDLAETFCNRGHTLHELKRCEEALASYERALTVRPDYAEALLNRGLTLHELKRFEEALASYERALLLRPDFAEALSNRGVTLHELKRFEEALASYNRALAFKPALAHANYNMGNVLLELGQLQEAQKAYRDTIGLDAAITGAYIRLAELKFFAPGDADLATMEALAAKTEGLSKIDRMQLDFALGKAYADLKDYHRSFRHLLEGNAGKRTAISYDEKTALALFDRIEAVFTSELIKAKSGGGEPSPMPIFVLGMPRSGTTLVEQIIASHPMVHGAGELQTLSDVILAIRGPDENTITFPESIPTLDVLALKQIGARYLASVRKLAPTAERVTDKMPQNYYFAGLIHLALPNAKIIHTVRNPVDTCISCFTKLFAAELNYTYELGELGRYYKRHERLMVHWRRVLPPDRILDVQYEDLIADLEGQARRIILHCGLPWDERCLSFHQTIRPVRTPSATQVRQPIYKNAVGRWRVYEEHLGPLLSALGSVTPVEA